MGDYDWKAGDTVVLAHFGSGSRRQIATVERVTPTGLPCVRGELFRKNGRQRGGGGGYSGRYIQPADPAKVAEVEAENRMRALRARALRAIDEARVGAGGHLTEAQCVAIIEALS